ncbi:MAG: phospholipase A [Deltaproteobacteria bacterium]|nr:phospholipase A [Deltaproteobacteria bacterium]
MTRHLLFVVVLFACIFIFGMPNDQARAEKSLNLEDCRRIDDDAARLNCYDEIAGRKPTIPAVTQTEQPSEGAERKKPSYLSGKWQLDDESRRRRFAIMSHRQIYILPFTYNFNQDKETFKAANPDINVQNAETTFQLSFKIKLWESIFGTNLDLWAAYTQLSLWQFYNTEASSPFRETNYEPEILFNYRMNQDIFGLVRSRFIQLGFNHQSNGRSEPLSRSWNRVVANFGFERDMFNIVLRTWGRVPESAEHDDNPKITSFLGYGELWLGAIWRDYHLNMMFRNNFRSRNRGAMLFEVSFPLIEHLNAYVQYFAGYGESLIDYNHYANRIGVGVILKDW